MSGYLGPDPHIHYRRHESPGGRDVTHHRTTVAAGSAPADAAIVSSRLPDGPAIVMREGACLVHRGEPGAGDQASVCLFPRLSQLRFGPSGAVHEIARFRGEPVYCFAAPEIEPDDRDEAIVQADPGVRRDDATDLPADVALEWGGYRELFGVLPEAELALLGRAMQVVAWDESSRFCPRCGEQASPRESECVKQCESCGHTQYPRLAPAMIVGVVREGKLLLAQSPRFRGVFHSILAGFVEPGETVEECVRREVYEEVGVRVTNIRYFGSQSWPFPHSFMLGFTAEWEAGELSPDPDEIVHAAWYAADEMPDTPSEVSISGRIIRWFRETHARR